MCVWGGGEEGHRQVSHMITLCHELYDARALRARGGASMWVWIRVRGASLQGKKSFPDRNNHLGKYAEDCENLGKASS